MYLLITKGTKLITPMKNRIIVLQEDIKIPVETKTVFETNLDEFNIYESYDNLDTLKEEVLYTLGFDYENYGLAKDEEIYGEETLKYKRKMLNLFKEVED